MNTEAIESIVKLVLAELKREKDRSDDPQK